MLLISSTQQDSTNYFSSTQTNTALLIVFALLLCLTIWVFIQQIIIDLTCCSIITDFTYLMGVLFLLSLFTFFSIFNTTGTNIAMYIVLSLIIIFTIFICILAILTKDNRVKNIENVEESDIFEFVANNRSTTNVKNALLSDQNYLFKNATIFAVFSIIFQIFIVLVYQNCNLKPALKYSLIGIFLLCNIIFTAIISAISSNNDNRVLFLIRTSIYSPSTGIMLILLANIFITILAVCLMNQSWNTN